MNRDEWTALAERCEKATGPDREIDIWIENYCGIARFRESHPWRASIDGQGVRSNVRPLTASHAVTALIERELPEYSWRLHKGQRYITAELWLSGDCDGHRWALDAATPALALCAAFCRAKAARAKE